VILQDLLTLCENRGFPTDCDGPFIEALVIELQECPAPCALDRDAFLARA
jgi:hypothetical protein